VLVTGGSRGIGRAICLAFAQEGWRVGIHYRERREEAELTCAAVVSSGGEGALFQADIRSAEQVRTMIRAFLDRWDRLDVVVCNAGQAVSGLLIRHDPEQWRQVIETNLTGTFHCLQAAAAPMLRRRDGSIIVVGSYAADCGGTGQAAYAASKAGLLGLVRTAAREWGRSNIRLNIVYPGWHQTELVGSAMPDAAHLDDHLLGRSPRLEEVARTVVHLALRQDVSGQIWNLDSRPV
jgi:3-oxoacyl-[acyl-carrier protein] reductase